ncbi:MAG: COX15/CtaA family protein, partial [Microbacteriaceae bacterium]|nr:COX15/CtaA family protein [Microbacteriaceae bacterium]
NTPEMGIHGVIEFGNRLLTILLMVIAVAVLAVLWHVRKERRDLWWMGVALLVVVPVQAVIGGISVWTQLNPYVVGLHFIVSVAATVVAMVIVLRVRDRDVVANVRTIPALSWLIGAVTAIGIVFGVLTTGSGPHAGDANAPRNGLNSELLQHIHAWSAYASVALVVVAILRSEGRLRRSWLALAGGFVFQIAIGITQARTGLPVELVGVHVLAAMVVTALATSAVYRSATSGSIATARNRAVK